MCGRRLSRPRATRWTRTSCRPWSSVGTAPRPTSRFRSAPSWRCCVGPGGAAILTINPNGRLHDTPIADIRYGRGGPAVGHTVGGGLMALHTDLRALRAEVGELVASHGRARSLDAFAKYANDPCGFILEALHADPEMFWSRQREIAE